MLPKRAREGGLRRVKGGKGKVGRKKKKKGPFILKRGTCFPILTGGETRRNRRKDSAQKPGAICKKKRESL